MTWWGFFAQPLSFVSVRVSQRQHRWHFGLDNYFLWGAALPTLRCSAAFLVSTDVSQSRHEQMPPDIAECPLVDKLAPSWEPFVYVAVHSWRAFSLIKRISLPDCATVDFSVLLLMKFSFSQVFAIIYHATMNTLVHGPWYTCCNYSRSKGGNPGLWGLHIFNFKIKAKIFSGFLLFLFTDVHTH